MKDEISEKKEHCCCHKEEEAPKEHCCCHEEHEAPQEHCCCHEEQKAHQEHCSHSEKHSHDCCHEKEHESPHSCCHHEEKEELEHSCCCCGEHKGTHAHAAGCGCCGDEEKEPSLKWRIVVLALSLASLIVSFIDLYERTGIVFFHYVDFAWIAVVLSGYSVFRSAVKSLARKKISSSVLISIAILASIALEVVRLVAPDVMGGHSHGESYVFAAGEVAFLMYLGGWIEDLTVARSRSGIEKMMSLAPATVELLDDGNEPRTVAAEEVNVGDLVLVRPGSVISVDGVVVTGSSAVDESAITGESIPVEKEVGSTVYGGTMNMSGMLKVKVTKRREDMWVSKVTELMREAEGKHAPIARLADKWAGYIVPSACILSLLVFAICAFIPGISVISAVIRGVTVLVVFCPCSLALATPTAIAAGIGALASDGVMVKNGGALETLAKVKTLCLDKTGTLTKGELSVESAVGLGVSEEELMRVAASAEQASEHPIAKAIVAAYGGEKTEVTDLQATAGVGIRAILDGKEVEICSYEAAQGRLLSLDEAAQAQAALGRTIVCVFAGGAPIGIIALADTVREEAQGTVSAAKELGVTPVMLTGDHRLTAEKVAQSVGIEEYHDSLRPEEKTAMVESYRKGGVTCMVGDGVNDAPALVTADCSISIASIGSEIAVESSDVALLDGKISKIPRLIRFARRVLRTIKMNIIFAMTVNVAAVVLSALGILTPVTGAVMHNGTSILVVMNSALLLFAGRASRKRIAK